MWLQGSAYRTYNWVTYFKGYPGQHTLPSVRSGGLPMNFLTDRAG